MIKTQVNASKVSLLLLRTRERLKCYQRKLKIEDKNINEELKFSNFCIHYKINDKSPDLQIAQRLNSILLDVISMHQILKRIDRLSPLSLKKSLLKILHPSLLKFESIGIKNPLQFLSEVYLFVSIDIFNDMTKILTKDEWKRDYLRRDLWSREFTRKNKFGKYLELLKTHIASLLDNFNNTMNYTIFLPKETKALQIDDNFEYSHQGKKHQSTLSKESDIRKSYERIKLKMTSYGITSYIVGPTGVITLFGASFEIKNERKIFARKDSLFAYSFFKNVGTNMSLELNDIKPHGCQKNFTSNNNHLISGRFLTLPNYKEISSLLKKSINKQIYK